MMTRQELIERLLALPAEIEAPEGCFRVSLATPMSARNLHDVTWADVCSALEVVCRYYGRDDIDWQDVGYAFDELASECAEAHDAVDKARKTFGRVFSADPEFNAGNEDLLAETMDLLGPLASSVRAYTRYAADFAQHVAQKRITVCAASN